MDKILYSFFILSIGTFLVQRVQPEQINEGFREVALRLHNEFRATKGLRPLELDPELNVIAHEYAEKLATYGAFQASGYGYAENLWAYRGQQRPLNMDTRDAVHSWYTGSKIPGNIIYQTDSAGYLSNSVRYLGIGVGTGNGDYNVVVAEYY